MTIVKRLDINRIQDTIRLKDPNAFFMCSALKRKKVE